MVSNTSTLHLLTSKIVCFSCVIEKSILELATSLFRCFLLQPAHSFSGNLSAWFTLIYYFMLFQRQVSYYNDLRPPPQFSVNSGNLRLRASNTMSACFSNFKKGARGKEFSRVLSSRSESAMRVIHP